MLTLQIIFSSGERAVFKVDGYPQSQISAYFQDKATVVLVGENNTKIGINFALVANLQIDRVNA